MKRKAFTAMLAAVLTLSAVAGTGTGKPVCTAFSVCASAAAVKESAAPVSGESGIFTYLKYPSSITISGLKTAPEGKLEIPERIDNLPVTGIGTDALAQCKEMTELVLPDTVEYMNSGAVAGCSKLKTVTLSQKAHGAPVKSL